MTARQIQAFVAACAALTTASSAAGQSAQADIGTIYLTGATFCPVNTLEVSGQVLSVSDYPGLFNLIGTTYGGDGNQTFNLPNLNGATPIGAGQGPSSNRPLGDAGGAEAVTLNSGNLATHTHVGKFSVLYGAATKTTPGNSVPAVSNGAPVYSNTPMANATTLNTGTATVQPTGGNAPVPIRNPYLVLRYCIVTDGTYPTPSQ